MDAVTYVITALGGTAILGTLLVWLIKKIADHFFQADIEAYKEQLRTASEKEITQAKHRFDLATVEHENKWKVLQTRRAEVIETLHNLLIDYLAAAEAYTAILSLGPQKPREELATDVDVARAPLLRFLMRHNFYLEESVVERTNAVIKVTQLPIIRFSISDGQISKGRGSHVEHMENWEAASDSVQKLVPPLLKELEDEFRRILGVPVMAQEKAAEAP